MHIKRKLTRRGLLAGLGAGTVLSPFIPLLDSHADEDGIDRRFVFFYVPHGICGDSWFPTGGPDDFELGEIHQPLVPWKNDIVVLDGIENRVAMETPGDAHTTGVVTLLTGRGLFDEPDVPVEERIKPDGISLDLAIAEAIAASPDSPPIPSLEAIAHIGGTQSLHAAGPGEIVYPEKDPYALFERVFSELDPTLGDEELERLRQQRKSVIDHVKQDLDRAKSMVGAADRHRIEQHLDAVRNVEQSLADLAELDCSVPRLPPGIDHSIAEDKPDALRLHTDIVVQALACGITRVASLQWEINANITLYTWVGEQEESRHSCAHGYKTDDYKRASLIKQNLWEIEQFAYLLQSLAAVQESNGSLLHNSLVMLGSSMGDGGHDWSRMGFLLAGQAGGLLPTGRSLDYGGRSHADLLTSVAQLMGLQLDSFGDPQWSTGPLPGLA